MAETHLSSSTADEENRQTAATRQVDWAAFLGRHDIIWKSLPQRWPDGAFLGNGQLGAMIFAQTEVHDANEANAEGDLNLPPIPVSEEPNITGLQVFLGRHDLCDIREDEPDPSFGKCRLPIGKLILRPKGQITGGELRLDLWNAEVRGSVDTTEGGFALRAFIHATLDVLVIDLQRKGGEQAAEWEWIAFPGSSSRVFSTRNPDYQRNPAPKVGEQKDIFFSIQNLLTGGGYATVWRELEETPQRDALYLNTAGVNAGRVDESFRVAVENLRGAMDLGVETLTELHREFWHDYYPKSFFSVPDDRLESFYWIQMYKLASATGKDKPAMDTMGPWYHFSRRPGMWFQKSLQMAYSPVYTANRLEQGESLVQLLQKQANALVRNADQVTQGAYLHDYAGRDLERPMSEPSRSTAGGEISHGNLIWLLHNIHRHCSVTADDELAYNLLYPLLRQAMNVYRAILRKGEDGRLHMPPSQTPGYPEAVADGNYDLALIRWACRTLQRLTAQLQVEDPLEEDWQRILSELVDSPRTLEAGLMIGAETPAPRGTSCFAHLLGICPLNVFRWDNPEHRAIMETSLENWLSKNSEIDSFGLAMAAAMAAALHKGKQARDLLLVLLQDFLTANTFSEDAEAGLDQSDDGGYCADLAPAFAAASALQSMVLQSSADVVEVFPAVPEDWQEVVFHRFRAQGGFFVSARRSQGRTAWIEVESVGNKPFRVRTGDDWQGAARVEAAEGVDYTVYSKGIVQVNLQPGQSAVIFPLDLTVKPVPRPQASAPIWGTSSPEG